MVETAAIMATDRITPKMVTIVLRLAAFMHFHVTFCMIFIGESPHHAQCDRPLFLKSDLPEKQCLHHV